MTIALILKVIFSAIFILIGGAIIANILVLLFSDDIDSLKPTPKIRVLKNPLNQYRFQKKHLFWWKTSNATFKSFEDAMAAGESTESYFALCEKFEIVTKEQNTISELYKRCNELEGKLNLCRNQRDYFCKDERLRSLFNKVMNDDSNMNCILGNDDYKLYVLRNDILPNDKFTIGYGKKIYTATKIELEIDGTWVIHTDLRIDKPEEFEIQKMFKVG